MNDCKIKKTGMRPITANLIKTGLFWLVLMITGSAFAQSTIDVVRGVVKNENGEIMSGASVTVQKSRISANTKKDGSFELHNVPAGATIEVSFVGYDKHEEKLKPGQTVMNLTMRVPIT